MIKTSSISQALLPVMLFLLLIWAVFSFDNRWVLNLHQFGIWPRQVKGLPGIVLFPLLHGDFYHIISNSLPLLVLGTMLTYFYRQIALPVFGFMFLFSGVFTWIIGNWGEVDSRTHVHIGASGLVYALAIFLFLMGIFSRNKALFGISLLVTFLYGTIIWGILPPEMLQAMRVPDVKYNVSWEGHLSGFVAGVLAAVYYRKAQIYTPLYSWDLEPEEEYIPEEEKYWLRDFSTEPDGKEETPILSSERVSLTPSPVLRIVYSYKDEQPKNKEEEEAS